ncbi:MAG: TonB-dependent receptor [Gammaproteobacteria bacterium]|nr:TonB-dependent receptor [Gammaproteobacteria bacterium]
MPRRQLPPRLPLVLALTWLALDPTPQPAAAQGLYFDPGTPLETGLVQRVFVGPHFTDAFAGSLLPVGRDRDQWTPFSFPYGLEPTSRGDSAGTEATLFGGGRALAGGRFRHADRVAGGALFEAAGHYLRGTDWPFADPVEARLREGSALLPARDDQLERWGAAVRYDLRPDDPDGWVFEGGLDRLRGNQLTEVGAAYARSWTRWHGRARYREGSLSADAQVRGRGAGEAVFYRTARDIEDRSLFFAGHIGHSARLAGRHNLRYGLDLRGVRPSTDGTVTGVHENADGILVAGGYLDSVVRIASRLDLATIVQLERHSRVDGLGVSPFASLIFRPARGHSFFVTGARAALMPSADHLLLDVGAGRMTAGVLIYNVLARGVPQGGFTFNDRCPGGFGGMCMRSPLAPGERLPADPAVLWNTLVEIAAASDPLALGPLRPFFRDPEPGELPPRLLLFNQKEWAAGRPPFLGEEVLGRPIGVDPIDPLQPSIVNSLSLQYRLEVGGRGRISAAVGRSSMDNFIGPLRVETPTVFFEPASTRAFIEKRVEPMVRQGIVFPALRELLIHDLTNLVLQLPVGTIMPDQVTTPGLLLTYRNYGRVDFSTAGLSAEVSLTPALSLEGTHAHISEQCFDFVEDSATDCSDLEDISLNLPKTKSSFSIRYEGAESGYSAEARMRRQRGFYANAGVYAGDVEGYTVVDAQVGFPVPGLPRASAALIGTNLLDDRHQEFIGAPEIGRLLVASLTYAFR